MPQAIRQQLSAAQQENQQVVGQLASLKQQLAAAQAAAAQATGGGSASAAAAEKALGEATKRAERLQAQVGFLGLVGFSWSRQVVQNVCTCAQGLSGVRRGALSRHSFH